MEFSLHSDLAEFLMDVFWAVPLPCWIGLGFVLFLFLFCLFAGYLD